MNQDIFVKIDNNLGNKVAGHIVLAPWHKSLSEPQILVIPSFLARRYLFP
jgi:hypothetical protein